MLRAPGEKMGGRIVTAPGIMVYSLYQQSGRTGRKEDEFHGDRHQSGGSGGG